MKKKKFVAIAVAISLLLASTVPVSASACVRVLVNGRPLVADVPPVIINGRTMLPFRAVFNALGIRDNRIEWHQSSKSIEVNKGVPGATYMFLMIGGTGAVVGDQLLTLDVAPYIDQSRTMVPLRFIAESLGATVDWDGKTRTATVVQ